MSQGQSALDVRSVAAAWRLVLNTLGLPAPSDLPEASAAASLGEVVLALARASHVRARRVTLRGEWWQQDNGSLIGCWAGRPVALLPQAHARGYRVVDPEGGASHRLGPSLAQELEPSAWTVYRPLPARPLRGWQVLHFALRGTGASLSALAAALVAGAAVTAATPLASGYVVDHVLLAGRLPPLAVLLTAMLGATMALFLFDLTSSLAVLRLESSSTISVQAAVWDRLLGLPAPFFRGFRVADLANRAMGMDQLHRVLSGPVLAGLVMAATASLSYVVLLRFDWLLAALTTLALVVMVAAVAGGWLAMRGQVMRLATVQGRTDGLVFELLGGISKLKMAAAEERAFVAWQRSFDEQQALAHRLHLRGVNLAGFQAGYPALGLFAIVAVLVSGRAHLTAGEFVAFSGAFSVVVGAAVNLASLVPSMLPALPVYDRARPILEAAPEVTPGQHAPPRLRGKLEVCRVSFRYRPEGPDILRDVSLCVEPGSFVAIVGASGSGKSTLMRLFLGFETPTSGQVRFDDLDLGELDIRQVRAQLGVVLQNAQLLPGDILSNILGTTTGLTMDDALAAAHASGLDDDLAQLPMGIHTYVAEGAATFSGGQRQRLLIARALVHRPTILLFDEATSALDNVSQARVMRSLEELRATRLVIAHRLSTVVHADRIVVLERGGIVESGSYDELMRADGPFAALARRQIA